MERKVRGGRSVRSSSSGGGLSTHSLAAYGSGGLSSAYGSTAALGSLSLASSAGCLPGLAGQISSGALRPASSTLQARFRDDQRLRTVMLFVFCVCCRSVANDLTA